MGKLKGDATGVAALAWLLPELARGGPRTVQELARAGGLARSTTFDLVRRLEDAGFVRRESGKPIPGPAATAFGFARFGLASLHGPAEALLTRLRDETGADVRLTSIRDGVECVLLLLRTARSRRGGVVKPILAPVAGPSGAEVAGLRLDLPAAASAPERRQAARALNRTRQTLEHILRNAG